MSRSMPLHTHKYMPACSASEAECENVVCMSYDADALSGPTHVNATQVYVTIVYICELCVAQRPTPPVDSLRSYVRIPTSEEFYARSTAGGSSQRGRLRGGSEEGTL